MTRKKQALSKQEKLTAAKNLLKTEKEHQQARKERVKRVYVQSLADSCCNIAGISMATLSADQSQVEDLAIDFLMDEDKEYDPSDWRIGWDAVQEYLAKAKLTPAASYILFYVTPSLQISKVTIMDSGNGRDLDVADLLHLLEISGYPTCSLGSLLCLIGSQRATNARNKLQKYFAKQQRKHDYVNQ